MFNYLGPALPIAKARPSSLQERAYGIGAPYVFARMHMCRSTRAYADVQAMMSHTGYVPSTAFGKGKVASHTGENRVAALWPAIRPRQCSAVRWRRKKEVRHAKGDVAALEEGRRWFSDQRRVPSSATRKRACARACARATPRARGLLDVFGFEDMPVNGFEQMFINLTNEWIQNLFNGVPRRRPACACHARARASPVHGRRTGQWLRQSKDVSRT